MSAPLPAVTVDRFWAKVRRRAPDQCWLWTGSRNNLGYGRFQPPGRSTANASRVSYEIANGPIESPRIFVCHRCDNPPCVNPAHLFLGTALENTRDAMQKGRLRQRSPRRRPHAALGEAIFAWRIRAGITQLEAADRLGAAVPSFLSWEAGRVLPSRFEHVLALVSVGVNPRLFPQISEALDVLEVA